MDENKIKQLNTQIPERVYILVKLHALTSRKSVNSWMLEAIQAKIESEKLAG